VSGSAIASARPGIISGVLGGHGQCLRPVVLILLLVDARKFFFFFLLFLCERRSKWIPMYPKTLGPNNILKAG
jgi:hypothetical protein